MAALVLIFPFLHFRVPFPFCCFHSNVSTPMFSFSYFHTRYQQILLYHMEHNDYDQVMDTCKKHGYVCTLTRGTEYCCTHTHTHTQSKFLHPCFSFPPYLILTFPPSLPHLSLVPSVRPSFRRMEPNLWVQALSYFASRQECKAKITEVLHHIEENHLMAPLMVVQTLAESQYATLSDIKVHHPYPWPSGFHSKRGTGILPSSPPRQNFPPQKFDFIVDLTATIGYTPQ